MSRRQKRSPWTSGLRLITLHSSSSALRWSASAAEKKPWYHIVEHLWWTVNTSHQVREAQERMHFLWRWKWVRIPFSIVTTFNRGTLESILTRRTTPWYHSRSSSDRKNLQRVARMAVRIIWEDSPSYGTLTSHRLSVVAFRQETWLHQS